MDDGTQSVKLFPAVGEEFGLVGLDMSVPAGEQCDSTVEPHYGRGGDGRPPGADTVPETAATADGDLFNPKAPLVTVKHEKAWHRMAIMLKVMGFSNIEIAAKLEVTPVMVSQVLRQQWARETMVKEINAPARMQIAKILESTALDSVFTLIEQRDRPDAKPSERISAANALLDRYLGKPQQTVEHRESTAPNMTELSEIDAELKRIDDEEKFLRGN
jgi:hypothetical protein